MPPITPDKGKIVRVCAYPAWQAFQQGVMDKVMDLGRDKKARRIDEPLFRFNIHPSSLIQDSPRHSQAPEPDPGPTTLHTRSNASPPSLRPDEHSYPNPPSPLGIRSSSPIIINSSLSPSSLSSPEPSRPNSTLVPKSASPSRSRSNPFSPSGNHSSSYIYHFVIVIVAVA
ncbi:hypothetical protein ACGC1H_005500 [Rhizoctonia solani]